jgi:hypothetical protein
LRAYIADFVGPRFSRTCHDCCGNALKSSVM